MTQTLANERVTQDRRETRNRTLRILAVPIFFLLLIDSLLGDSLMYSPQGQPFPLGALAFHVGVALLLVVATGLALGLSLRLPGWRPRAAAAFTHGSTVGATIAGVVFLFGGENPTALTFMEGLAAIAFLGAIALGVWGSVALPDSSAPTNGRPSPRGSHTGAREGASRHAENLATTTQGDDGIAEGNSR